MTAGGKRTTEICKEVFRLGRRTTKRPISLRSVRSGPVQVSSLVVSIDCRTKGGRPRRPYFSTRLRSAVSPRDTVTRSPATTRRKLRIRLMIAFYTKSIGAFFAGPIKTIAFFIRSVRYNNRRKLTSSQISIYHMRSK